MKTLKNLHGPTYQEVEDAYVTTEKYRSHPHVKGQVHVATDEYGNPAVVSNPLIDMTWRQAVKYHNEWHKRSIARLSARNSSFQLSKEEKKQLMQYASDTDEDENLSKYPPINSDDDDDDDDDHDRGHDDNHTRDDDNDHNGRLPFHPDDEEEEENEDFHKLADANSIDEAIANSMELLANRKLLLQFRF